MASAGGTFGLREVCRHRAEWHRQAPEASADAGRRYENGPGTARGPRIVGEGARTAVILSRAVSAARRGRSCGRAARGLRPGHPSRRVPGSRSRLGRVYRGADLRVRAPEGRFTGRVAPGPSTSWFLRAGGRGALGADKRGRKAERGNTQSRAGRKAAAPAPNPRSGSGVRRAPARDARRPTKCAGSKSSRG